MHPKMHGDVVVPAGMAELRDQLEDAFVLDSRMFSEPKNKIAPQDGLTMSSTPRRGPYQNYHRRKTVTFMYSR
jgi:hypothetical protein